MKSTLSIARYLVFGVAALLFAACSSQMQPARQAIDDISGAVAATSEDAAKYIPEQLSDVQHKLADMNAAYDKKDYATVLAEAPAVLTEAKGLPAAAAAKKDEIAKALAAEWAQLSASVPQLVTSVKTRVEALSKSRRVPKDVNLSAAKSGLQDSTVLWEQAQAASKDGNVAAAVAAAKDAKTKAEAAASALKMS
ncbi:MAG: hypothetical protein ABSG12_05075 [Steroidobacteraceae bacterium]|jgi:hypothetical protein